MKVVRQWNRLYLLGSMMLSCLLPFLPQISFGPLTNSLPAITLPEVIVGTSTVQNLDNISTVTGSGLSYWWLIGSAIYAAFIIVSFIRLWSIRSESRFINGFKTRITPDIRSPFSFVDTVYLPEHTDYSDQDLESILIHEGAHIRYKHSWDILFMPWGP